MIVRVVSFLWLATWSAVGVTLLTEAIDGGKGFLIRFVLGFVTGALLLATVLENPWRTR